jgi:hypothetical protein
VDVQTFENGMKSFVVMDENRQGLLDGLAFLTIMVDFGLLNSSVRSFAISQLFGFFVQYPPTDAKSTIGIFICDGVHLIDLS